MLPMGNNFVIRVKSTSVLKKNIQYSPLKLFPYFLSRHYPSVGARNRAAESQLHLPTKFSHLKLSHESHESHRAHKSASMRAAPTYDALALSCQLYASTSVSYSAPPSATLYGHSRGDVVQQFCEKHLDKVCSFMG